MVNSASQALAEFKSQRMGGLLSGSSSTVNGPNIDTSIQDNAAERMARSAPKRSTSAFMNQIRQRGESMHQTAMQGIAAKQAAERQRRLAQAMGGGGGGGSAYSGYRAPGMADRSSKSGAYGYQPFSGRYGLTPQASSWFTRLEGAYRQQFNQNFQVGNAWRSIEQEQELWNAYQNGTGPMASVPGQGVHGYGTAVDINGPMNNPNSAQHRWMQANAAQYGWFWVGQRWGEPWHWEFFPDRVG